MSISSNNSSTAQPQPDATNGHLPVAPLAIPNPFQGLRRYQNVGDRHGMSAHFFESNEQILGREVQINGRYGVSFSSYDYLGYSSEPRVRNAVREAVDRFGTSASGSRLIGGDCAIH